MDSPDMRKIVGRLVAGESALKIARSLGYRTAEPVLDAARVFIVTKLGAERYAGMVRRPGVGIAKIVLEVGHEALKKY